jgi:hypothetical protein
MTTATGGTALLWEVIRQNPTKYEVGISDCERPPLTVTLLASYVSNMRAYQRGKSRLTSRTGMSSSTVRSDLEQPVLKHQTAPATGRDRVDV